MLKNMNKKQKRLFRRILCAGALFTAGMILPYFIADETYSAAAEWLLFIGAFAAAGYDIVLATVSNIRGKNIFDEQFLMTVASAGAFALGEHSEAAAVMLFYQVGELFQSCAVSSSRKSISSLMDMKPESAEVERGGSVMTVSPEEVDIGEIIVIRPGERVPIDGVIEDGSTSLDTSALTGESMPRFAGAGDEVLSGCINQTGLLRLRTSRSFGESAVSRILDLVENASDKKAHVERFITRFARWYTPAVVIAAALMAAVMPFAAGDDFSVWIYRAMTFLVISCPCALVISVPLSFFGGIGGASRRGILFKGSSSIEMLAKVKNVVFDKTGTLTKGAFSVTKICPQGMTDGELLELAAYAEDCSSHPIALSVKSAYGRDIDRSRIRESSELAGHGVRAEIDGAAVLAGKADFMTENGINPDHYNGTGTIIHIAKDREYCGYIIIEDEIKPDAAEAVRSLRKLGIRYITMLTGDSEAVGRDIAEKLGLDDVYAQLLPEGKVEILEELMAKGGCGGMLAFAGDGINDAPVIARADVGIAMGAHGSDAAIEAADVVLMTDEPSQVASAIKTARRTVSIARQNIVIALGIKLIVLALGALGCASMWAAVFADVGASVIAILNAVRTLRYNPSK